MALERLTQITQVGIQSGITLQNINVEGANVSGVVTATTLNVTGGGANFSGVVTATSFIGNVTGNINPSSLVVTGVSTFQASSFWGDGDVAYFGDDQDLLIFHNSTDSIIRDTGTGDLYIEGGNVIRMTNPTGIETYATFNQDASVELYYDGNKKFETTGSGVIVTGVVTATSFSGDGSALTGIDATSLKDSGGNVKVQANTSGAVVTGVLTATSFSGDGSALTGLASDAITEGNTSAEVVDTGSDGHFKVVTEGTEALRVDASRRLLVGTNTNRTGFALQLEGTNYNQASLSLTNNQNTGNSGYITLNKTRGTAVGSYTIVNDNDPLGIIEFVGSDGSNFQAAAKIEGRVDGTPSAGAMPGRLQFYTTPPSSTTLTERMRIDSSGRVTMPYQPAFYAYQSGGSSTTTTGAWTGSTWNSTKVNVGSHFSTSTSRFTAPITGTYTFTFVSLARRNSSDGSIEPTFYVNGSNISIRGSAYTWVAGTNDHDNISTTVYLYLNANDYVQTGAQSIATGTDLYYGQQLGSFSGHLIG